MDGLGKSSVGARLRSLEGAQRTQRKTHAGFREEAEEVRCFSKKTAVILQDQLMSLRWGQTRAASEERGLQMLGRGEQVVLEEKVEGMQGQIKEAP